MGKFHRQREADIAQAHYADARAPRTDLFREDLYSRIGGCWYFSRNRHFGLTGSVRHARSSKAALLMGIFIVARQASAASLVV